MPERECVAPNKINSTLNTIRIDLTPDAKSMKQLIKKSPNNYLRPPQAGVNKIVTQTARQFSLINARAQSFF